MEALRAAVRDVPDFPTAGIVFKDLTAPARSLVRIQQHRRRIEVDLHAAGRPGWCCDLHDRYRRPWRFHRKVMPMAG